MTSSVYIAIKNIETWCYEDLARAACHLEADKEYRETAALSREFLQTSCLLQHTTLNF